MFYSTKIIATLGPASSSQKIIRKMLKAGAGIFRINTAHKETEYYDNLVSNIRAVSKEATIIVDLKGPEIRVKVKSETNVSKKDELWFGFTCKEKLSFNKNFIGQVKKGTKIFFEDGKYFGKIIDKGLGRIKIKFYDSFNLKCNTGINIPNIDFDFDTLTKKDKKIISWAKNKKIETYALSFCRSAKDIKELRKKVGKDSIIIAKIESKQGVNNYSKILKEADGIMIARGDLGAEIKRELIPLLQKKMIKEAINEGKFSIVATQMLESMIKNKYPTRAEISDIANSVLDGADCLMLSGETAIGISPVDAVKEMRRSCEAVEENIPNLVDMKLNENVSDSITKSIYDLCNYLKADKIIAFTKSGYTCQMISRFRIPKPIIGLSWSKRTFVLLSFYFSVCPHIISGAGKLLTGNKIKFFKREKLVKKGETVIVTGNLDSSQKQHSNLIEVQKI